VWLLIAAGGLIFIVVIVAVLIVCCKSKTDESLSHQYETGGALLDTKEDKEEFNPMGI